MRTSINMTNKTIPEADLLQRAKNFTSAITGWASGGFQLVDDQAFQSRLQFCKSCEYWKPDAFLNAGKCGICGCSVGKLYLPQSKCPHTTPRWLATTSSGHKSDIPVAPWHSRGKSRAKFLLIFACRILPIQSFLWRHSTLRILSVDHVPHGWLLLFRIFPRAITSIGTQKNGKIISLPVGLLRLFQSLAFLHLVLFRHIHYRLFNYWRRRRSASYFGPSSVCGWCPRTPCLGTRQTEFAPIR